jgi:hypothetical protein
VILEVKTESSFARSFAKSEIFPFPSYNLEREREEKKKERKKVPNSKKKIHTQKKRKEERRIENEKLLPIN